MVGTNPWPQRSQRQSTMGRRWRNGVLSRMVVASMTDSSRAEYLFADDEQRRLEATLTRITSRLEGIAQRDGLLRAAEAGGAWPARTPFRRIWTKAYRRRISPEPTYVRTGSIRWNVH